jgi:hypothetical protein
MRWGSDGRRRRAYCGFHRWPRHGCHSRDIALGVISRYWSVSTTTVASILSATTVRSSYAFLFNIVLSQCFCAFIFLLGLAFPKRVFEEAQNT